MEHTEADVQKVNGFIDAGKQAMEEKVFFNPTSLQQNLFDESRTVLIFW